MFEIGSSLREARTRQGFDFTEMEFRTKVRAKYLRALEAEQFEQLPGHTYIKGFLRTYAESLGMDGQLYVDEYNSRYVAGEEERPLRTRRVPTQSRRQRQHRESRLVVIAVMAMILLTALVIAAWKFGDTTEPKVQGVNVRRRPTAATVARGVSVTATRGASFMEVRAGVWRGQAALPGHARARAGEAVRAAEADDHPHLAEERHRSRRGCQGKGAKERSADPSARLLSRPRVAIVVTGSELVRGERTDLNGPFFAQEALRLGLQPVAHHDRR